MARDAGLEELVRETLGDEPHLTDKRMFGGLCWLHRGNLLCGASGKGMLVRLGKGLDGWALEHDGIGPMEMSGRSMPGWVRVQAAAYGDDALRARLVAAALKFVRALPAKP